MNPPLLYVFFEVAQLERQRRLLESGFGFPVIEVEPHMPHHRHGVVKYDAGGVILSLNLTDGHRFLRDTTDALVSVIEVPAGKADGWRSAGDGFVSRRAGEIVDAHGHHFIVNEGPPTRSTPRVDAFRLIVDDLAKNTAFYRDVLGLAPLEKDAATSRFAAGRVDLILEERTSRSDRQRRHDTYLLVFYTADIVAAQRGLASRGAPFKRPTPGYSEIGGSSRFDDPAGNHLCLYQPSDECLTWGSGSKVREISHIEGGPNARRLADSVLVRVRD